MAGVVTAAGAAVAADGGPSGPIGRPGPPPKTPVTETYFGHQVTDDWRGMEALDPATLNWMKGQGAYTRSVLDSIAPLKALQGRVSAFTGSFGFVNDFQEFGGRMFYTERVPGSDVFNLMVRDSDGKTRKLVDVAALKAAHGVPYAVNYIQPSPDGTMVAAGVSSGGSEEARLTVYDAATGAVVAGPLERMRFGVSAWSNDSRRLFVLRNKKLGPGDPPTDFERYVQAQVWDLKGEPIPLAGAGSGHGPEISPDEFAAVGVTPGSDLAVLIARAGVQNELRAWLGDSREPGPDTRWTPIATVADGVTNIAAAGSTLYLLSHKDAPTFQVLSLTAGQPLSAARVVIPARADRVLDNLTVASDGLYVEARDGVYSHLLRIPTGSSRIEEIALPVKGHLGSLFSDPRAPGVVVELSSWVSPPINYRYDPASGRFADLRLGVRGDIRTADFEVRDLDAAAKDGVKVPLTLVVPKGGGTGPRPTVIEAYGSYGISNLADFSPRRAAFMKEGIIYGVCHVRGGGELGDAWRLAGKDADKPNTWRDLIACGDDLVARGITDRSKLFIIGGSAGGITMGRSMEERPDLFAGVLDMVPAANTMRAEFSPNGPPNVPEFGSVKTEAGFANLYEMDSVLHVKRGVAYPAVMISTGLNDPRVAPWEPAKFAAALEAAGDPNPVLLRIDEQAGHGIGSTRSQTDLLTADGIAFVFWRSGSPDWRPSALAR
jgi:prolyl oligopeptidase